MGQTTSAKAATIKSQLQQAQSIQQTANSSSVESAFSAISSIFQNGVSDLAQAVEELLSHGLLTGSLLDLLNGYADFSLNSDSNNNPKSPATPIYPSKASGDAPYTVDEDTLRAAIYIPESFSYGANGKMPVILVPGTAIPAGMIKLGSAANVDPVWVNIPKASLGDVRVNSEYVAYAINYISGVSASSNVSVISWSQGGINTQWALKYWPSTRSVVSDFIALSPDFHGTIESILVCPGFV
ncbi:Lipase, partial [Rasamsonia emersonii CBS 393.64]